MANTHEVGSLVTVEAKFAEQITNCKLIWRSPAEAEPIEYTLEPDEKRPDGTVTHDIPVDAPGEWYYRFEAQDPQVGVADGAFFVDGDQVRDAVTDLRDLRTLIPRVRRALEGPGTTALSSEISDLAAEAVLADAVSDVLLYTGGSNVFGYQLEVTARDGRYNAPVHWRTDRELSLAAQSVVIAQAAIGYLFQSLSILKTSETIKDEGGEWSYTLSAQAVNKRLDSLMRLRDDALAEVEGQVYDLYESFLAVRDAAVSAVIEPYVNGAGVGGLEQDWRFG